MAGCSTASFIYDGDGNRVKTVISGVTTTYIGNYFEKSSTTVKKYYYYGSTRVAMRSGSSLYFLLSDHLGSTTMFLNSSGSRVTELMYKPWGENRFTYGLSPSTFQYTGQRNDSIAGGLYYYGARYFDSALGRFISADTAVPGAGNPQAWDRYAYTSNSPVNYTDPNGHQPCPNGRRDCDNSGRNFDRQSNNAFTNQSTSPVTPTPTNATGWSVQPLRTSTPTVNPSAYAAATQWAQNQNNPLQFITPTPTGQYYLNADPNRLGITTLHINWKNVDWLDFGIDVVGIVGDAASFTGIGEIPYFITEGVEVFGLLHDIAENDVPGVIVDNVSIMDGILSPDGFRLIPFVGWAGNLYSLGENISDAMYTIEE